MTHGESHARPTDRFGPSSAAADARLHDSASEPLKGRDLVWTSLTRDTRVPCLSEPHARDVVDDAEEVRTAWEHDVSFPRASRSPGRSVRAQELHESAKYLDALPLVAPGDAGIQRPPRLAWRGLSSGLVPEHPRDPDEAAADISSRLSFPFRERDAQLLAELGGRGESWRRGELERRLLGKAALRVEEVLRASDLERCVPDSLRRGPQPRPQPTGAHHACGDGIGEDVGGLVDDVFWRDEGHGAVAVRRPEGLPAPKRRIEGARGQRVEELMEQDNKELKVEHPDVDEKTRDEVQKAVKDLINRPRE